MEIRKGQKVKVICTEARLKEVGVKQKHIKQKYLYSFFK